MKKYGLLLISLLLIVSLCGSVFAAASDVKPTLTLKVNVIPTTISGQSLVVYTAKLYPATISPTRPVIDFYCSNNPISQVYPNIYLGSVSVDNTGTAILKVIQKTGKYLGAAIWNSPVGRITAPIVMYSVP